ncbi:hypothetical protein TWF694_004542 [Orbilia ellipsospora]|uniref:Uncharacterized protein n=1 Tax=Orbilia ellipsospora TaxID=2528407 RepID=A0AAV9WVT5_9PEZI
MEPNFAGEHKKTRMRIPEARLNTTQIVKAMLMLLVMTRRRRRQTKTKIKMRLATVKNVRPMKRRKNEEEMELDLKLERWENKKPEMAHAPSQTATSQSKC